MFQILCPSIIHIFTPISFPQLLIVFLVQPYIFMEPLNPIVFVVPYANVSNILEFYQPHSRYGNVLHHIGILTCDSHHNFAAIQGIECEINCLNFRTVWEGVCTYLFSISDYVSILEFDRRKKHSNNSPTSSDDEIQGVSPLPSCRFYTLTHDHGVHDLFNKSSSKRSSFS